MPDLRPEPLTQLSFENSRAELIDRINALRQAAGKPPIVDDHATNPHLMFIENLALYAELTGVTIDNRILGAILVIARNLEDGTLAAESIGYDWRGVAPAVVGINLNFGSGGWPKDITLAAGHKFYAEPDYILEEETEILAGTESVDLTLKQITKKQHTVISNGQQTQEFLMPEKPVVKESATATVDGNTYRVVKHLFELFAGEEGLSFLVNYLEQGKVTTGDGVNGVVIPLGASIVINYSISEGADGRIGANIIDGSVDQILDIDTDPVTVTITQPFASSGGENRESLESMQFNGPLSLRTLNASINRSDFVTNAEQVDGVVRALALTNLEDSAIAANTTLILIATESPDVGETTLFNDDHNDDIIPAGTWTEISGSWAESGGQMYGSLQTDIIELAGNPYYSPIELRATVRALTTNPCSLILRREGYPNDYLYAEIDSDGAGNTTFRLGQVIDSVQTENATTEAIDTQVLVEAVLGFSLNDGLYLKIDGDEILNFSADNDFRGRLYAQYKGEISVDLTTFVSLVDLPFPNQALIDEVVNYIIEQRPTLVSHRVSGGQMRFLPLNLELDLETLTGFTVTQVRANIIAAMQTFLSLTRRKENREYVNLPGIELSLDDIYAAMKIAAGIDKVRIQWPEDFDIVPEAQEMIILGEIKWL